MALFDRKSPPSRERTNEDRERARQEREARRAAREGIPPEQAIPPPLETPPPAAEPVRSATEQSRPVTGQQARPVTERARPVTEQDRAITEPARPNPRPAQPFPDPARPVTEQEGLVTRQDGPVREQTRSVTAEDRRPAVPGRPAPRAAAPTAAPPRPAAAPARAPDLDGAGPRVARTEAPSVVLDDDIAEDWSGLDAPPPRRASRGRSGPPSPRRWPLALLITAVLTVLGAGWFLMQLFQPVHGDGGAPVSVSIPRGAGVGQAGDILAERGAVSSAFFFKLRAKLEGTGEIKPGNYTFREDTSFGDALAALAKGPPPPKTTDITITEGRTITEANRLLRRTSLRGSYAAAAARSTALRPQQYGAPRSIRTKEGFLFPATYKVRVGAPVADLVSKQLQTFRKEFAAVDLRYARSKNLTPYEVLIVASMIEREASVPKDRRLIASVIYNRLAQSIPLGIDATIRYQLDNWQRPLRMSELERDTPYNTRLHQGLPPTPIGNPGLASIRAAANPSRTDFLYFVVKPCGKGEHAFTKTDAEFQRAVQRYEAERQRQGGSPVEC